ncbi:polygalacturonase 1 beta-like protein 3 [Vicia villosa]|uniref:polygalacturonase 1 beta-like protein 3 n=1 Tax=Vicia villosa TaxID=3911 RepID=UPI00273CD6AB|nr:polygalacturonase 1 beta-like protein 3 [Vicia villosa]
MEFHFFRIITFLMLLLVATNAARLPPQHYWKSVIPNSPMPKAITNLLLPSETDVSSKELSNWFRYDHTGVDVNSKKLPNWFRYDRAASGSDVNSEELPNWFRYDHAVSGADVSSEELPNWFRYDHAVSGADVSSEELPNWFRYNHAASEPDVNSEELSNVFKYDHAASEPDVSFKKFPNVFKYDHAARKPDVSFKKLPNVFKYDHAASEPDVSFRKLPNVFKYDHVASEHDVSSRYFPNVFKYDHAASESDVSSKYFSNVFKYDHAASEPEVNFRESPNGFSYHHAASEPGLNSRESLNGFFYRNAASEPNVNFRKSPNGFSYHQAASVPDVNSGETSILSYNPPASEFNVNSGKLSNAFSYDHSASEKPKSTIFFFEKDLHHGTKSYIRFAKTNPNNEAKFLPREVASSIPFSSKKLEYILNKLNIKKGSKGARIVNNTITDCEVESIKGEEKLCVTSLESMIDFSISKIGKNLEAVSTEMYKESDFQQYKVITQGVKRLGEKNKAVVCHKQNYPYAVFFCHTTDTTKVYSAPLKGVDGSIVKAIVVCHTDTSQWNPKHFAFLELKVKVGSGPICHLLPQDHVAWISK